MSREQEVLDQMRDIIDPDLGKDIVSLGFIKDLSIDGEGRVAFVLELTTPACPVKEQFKTACEDAVSRLPWVTDVQVLLSARPARPAAPQPQGLARVQHLVAVSSCKGGVGKSTVAVNLAFALSGAGARVGLFDADVYGPSLPTMVRPEETELYAGADDLIEPLTCEGIRLMSFGFVPRPPGEGAAILRGPMVSQIINQLLTGTDWGELDYLVIDMPPGTGDIALTLAQGVPITAALIVTTPQQLSFVDVVKGIQMFDKLKIPTIGVVENMSYFICDGCDKRHYPFGQGAREQLVNQYGFKHTFEVPIDPEVSRLGDRGRPLVLEHGDSEPAKIYREIAGYVAREVSKIAYGALAAPRIRYEADRGIVVSPPDGEERVIPPADLRRRCRCAVCVEETSGRPLLDPDSVPEDIYPTAIQPMGNYAVAISWSDGHTSSIYPYDSIVAGP